MAEIQDHNPHQDEINKLAARVLPRVRAMPFAQNTREPWLSNETVDKAVIATIETCFALADEDRAPKVQEVSFPELPADESKTIVATSESVETQNHDFD